MIARVVRKIVEAAETVEADYTTVEAETDSARMDSAGPTADSTSFATGVDSTIEADLTSSDADSSLEAYSHSTAWAADLPS